MCTLINGNNEKTPTNHMARPGFSAFALHDFHCGLLVRAEQQRRTTHDRAIAALLIDFCFPHPTVCKRIERSQGDGLDDTLSFVLFPSLLTPRPLHQLVYAAWNISFHPLLSLRCLSSTFCSPPFVFSSFFLSLLAVFCCGVNTTQIFSTPHRVATKAHHTRVTVRRAVCRYVSVGEFLSSSLHGISCVALWSWTLVKRETTVRFAARSKLLFFLFEETD